MRAARAVLVSLAAGLLLPSCSERRLSGPRLRFETELHHFGELYLGEEVEQRFTLHNDGDESLAFDRIRSSCGCAVVEGPGRALAPGESAELNLRVIADQGPGRLDKTVTVHCNDPRSPRTLRFTVDVLPLYELEPALVEWGEVVHGGTCDSRVEVRRVDGRTLTLGAAQETRLGTLQVEAGEGGASVVALALDPALPVGLYFEHVVIETRDTPVPVKIPVRVQVVPPFRLEPEDSLPLGQFASSDGITANALAIALDPDLAPDAVVEATGQVGKRHDPWLEVEVEVVEPGQEFQVQVRVRPGAPGGAFLGKVDVWFRGRTDYLRTLTLSGTVIR